MMIQPLDADMFDSIIADGSLDVPHFPESIRRVMLEAGTSFALWHDCRPFGIGGIIPIHKGAGEIWMVISDELKTRPRALVETSKALVKLFLQDYGYHRIQLSVDVSNKLAVRFAKFLGFKREAVMKHFGPQKQDYYLMTWHRQE